MTGTAIDERPRRRPDAPHLAMFLALGGSDPLFGGRAYDLGGLEEITIGRGSPASVQPGPNATARIELPDPTLSTQHARLRVLPDHRVSLEDLGSRNGTRVRGKRVRHAELAEGDVFVAGRSAFLLRLVREPVPIDPAVVAGAPLLTTLAPELAREWDGLCAVAPGKLPVLVLGETGTGKEVIAQAVHALAGRSGKLIAVNCAALPDTLIESELFGYRRGAFSGAKEDRPGLVRAADGGTLFLDEIGDMPAASQAKILRVLQESEVLALGATLPVSVDVRVVAATQRDLHALAAGGGFRLDLLARLQGHTITLPPLRGRREDLGLMVAALLRRHAGTDAPRVRLTADACAELLARPWPLNVRELERTIQRAVELVRASAPASTRELDIDVEHLPSAVTPAPTRSAEDERRALRDELVRQLTLHRGNVTSVAKAMGKARMQIQRWMAGLGIDPTSFRR